MLGLLGDEWSLLILQQALLGATRYGEFMSRLPISNAVLTVRLRALTEDLLLDRVVYQTNPVRAEYLTTARSRSLWPVLVSIWTWERAWVEHHSDPLPAMCHVDCGHDFTPALVCAGCMTVTTDCDLLVHWGPSGSWPRSVPASANRRRPSAAPRATTSTSLFPHTMSVFGNRWSAALLIAAFLGTTRFGEFEDRLGAPPASISERLRTFRANGILDGDAEYLLTEKGRAFLPVLITALQWAQEWFHAPEGDAVLLSHRECGRSFTGVLACDQCETPLRGARIGVV